jgi:hypothetical protein
LSDYVDGLVKKAKQPKCQVTRDFTIGKFGRFGTARVELWPFDDESKLLWPRIPPYDATRAPMEQSGDSGPRGPSFVDLVTDDEQEVKHGTALVFLQPTNYQSFAWSFDVRPAAPLWPICPRMDLFDVSVEQRTRTVCLRALRDEESTSVTSYNNMIPGRKEWQIQAVPSAVLTAEMAEISVRKGCKLEELPQEMQRPEFLANHPQLVEIARDIEQTMISMAEGAEVLLH